MTESTAAAAARVLLSRSLYDPEAVAAAVAGFAGLADIELDQDEEHVILTCPGAAAADDPELLDELCNHALYQTIVRRRRAATEEGS